MPTSRRQVVESWGRLPGLAEGAHQVFVPHWGAELAATLEAVPRPLLACGLRRSYGDSCLNVGHTLVDMTGMDRFVSADWSTGVVTVEPGLTIRDLAATAAARGFFVPVVPGTQIVTVAGAVANDIHGKNHHRQGTFGRHVVSLKLWRSDRGDVVVSPEQEPALFAATIGGLGLTGVITQVTLRLMRVSSPRIQANFRKIPGLDAFIESFAAVDREHEYSVGWIDCVTQGRGLGRGILHYGDHADASVAGAWKGPRGNGPLRVPLEAPSNLLNRYTVAAFNAAYYTRNGMRTTEVTDYEPFFFPLDSVGGWNKIYGRQGFFQYQMVVPLAATATLRKIVETVAKSGSSSFLAVLKSFSAVQSPGMLSFPTEGWTLALDFPNRGARTEALFRSLDELVFGAGGRLYAAKDARMSPEAFAMSAPRLAEFRPHIDPACSSDLARRLRIIP